MILKMNFNFNFKIVNLGGVCVLLMRACAAILLAAMVVAMPVRSCAQETYLITYSHQMEEPGNLELALKSTSGFPHGAHTFTGEALEFEYGVKAWWTSEVYLDGQNTSDESTVFTGFRFENRFRPLLSEHWINPVLYVEFENINGADKTLLEVVGHDGRADFLPRNDRSEKKREAEVKLILSSNFKGWNVSENLIAEKQFNAPNPWEFGYAMGVSRPLSLVASPKACVFCRENFSMGAEMYGGLGDRYTFGLGDTSHYLGPLVNFRTPAGPAFTVSPAFGLNQNSHGMLVRFAASWEIDQVFRKLRGK
jgi:hypothetical protein